MRRECSSHPAAAMAADTYRSLEPATAARFEALLERYARENPQATAVRAIVERRIGRVVAGVVAGLVGASALLTGLLLTGPASPFVPRHLVPAGFATSLLLAAWPLALAAGFLVRAVARLRFARVLRAPSMPAPALALTELSRLEDARPLLTLRRRAARIEGWSAAAPLAGLSLTAPLTLHLIVSPAFERAMSVRDFDDWIAVSALLVGPAHLVLVFFAVRWALTLRRREIDTLHKGIHASWMKAVLVTAIAGAVPCALLLAMAGGGLGVMAVVLLLIPAAITAGTGMVFIPAMYLLAARRIARERLALA
jgi:hypothetical protein